MGKDGKLPISIQVLNEAIKRKDSNKTRLSNATHLALRTIQAIFNEKRASMKTVLAIGKALDVSPTLLLSTAYDNNGSYDFSDPSDWETYEQWEKWVNSDIALDRQRRMVATSALIQYLDNVEILDPEGKPYRIDGTLLFTSDFKLEERIKQTIRDYLIEIKG